MLRPNCTETFRSMKFPVSKYLRGLHLTSRLVPPRIMHPYSSETEVLYLTQELSSYVKGLYRRVSFLDSGDFGFDRLVQEFEHCR